MNKKVKDILMMGLMASAFAENSMNDFYDEPKKLIIKKQNNEPIIKNGQFYYWFRIDGTFLNEKQSERMLKDECVFTCYAINDKNAIKKFNKFIK